jgi:transcriptional regulator with XRE-family HTH domain
MNSKKFGKNLKDILGYLEMTQHELAIRSGITQAAVSQIISGKREPSLGTVCAILKAVPVNFERLVRD